MAKNNHFKRIFLLVSLSLLLCLSACAKQIASDNSALEGTYSEKVKVTGSFYAQVRELVPDYVLDGKTPRLALVTLFQSNAFLVPLDSDLIEQLSPGKIYEFQLEEKMLDGAAAKAYQATRDAGLISIDTALNSFHLKVISVEERSDYGTEDGLQMSQISP